MSGHASAPLIDSRPSEEIRVLPGKIGRGARSARRSPLRIFPQSPGIGRGRGWNPVVSKGKGPWNGDC